MSRTIDKAVAHEIVDSMPDGATWEDLLRELHLRERIEAGLEDSRAGRITHVSEIRKKYGLDDRTYTGLSQHRTTWMRYFST